MITIHQGDCPDVLRAMADSSIDAICTDPPYGLSEHKPATIMAAITAWTSGGRGHVPDGRGFMSAQWDAFVPPPAVWDECLRVLKPGGHMLVFAGTRTVDLMGLSIRLAGFEIRDSISWLYGSGFPKSLDVSKAIDKAAGAEREVVGTKLGQPGYSLTNGNGDHRTYGRGLGNTGAGDAERDITAPATDAAKQWAGFGTALKPASEPIIVARKPLVGTVAANVLAHGTGGINVDVCRVNPGTAVAGGGGWAAHKVESTEGWDRPYVNGVEKTRDHTVGRWPTNVVLDEHAAAELDAQSGTLTSGKAGKNGHTRNKPDRDEGIYGGGKGLWQDAGPAGQLFSDSGGASRFFPVFKYQAKAPTRERPKVEVDGKQVGWPTVKPLELMRWLVRLVTPPGGTVLDPFAGSGTTGHAAALEGFASVLIERDERALRLIAERLGRAEIEFEVIEPLDELGKAIADAGDDTALTALWRANKSDWTPAHTDAAKARLVELRGAVA